MHRQKFGRLRATQALVTLVAALVAAFTGVLVAASPAQAISVCMDPNPPDWCYDNPPPQLSPGDLTSATRVPGGVKVAGWARRTGTAYTSVKITIGGVVAGTLVANGGTTLKPTFSGTVTASHAGQVCAETAAGADLGCASLVVSLAPYGSLDASSASGGTVHLAGWAIDPDTTAAISVQVRRDGTTVGTYTAGNSRPDVGTAYPGYGNNHGFDLTLSQGPDGTHSVCLYAVNASYGSGSVRLGGCLSYTAKHEPYGAIHPPFLTDAVATVNGWAIDPDQPDTPVTVRVAVDGTVVTTAIANQSSPDADTGGLHGFHATFPASLTPGNHQVCVTAVSLSWGADKQIGCGSYTTPGPPGTPVLTQFTDTWPYRNTTDTSSLWATRGDFYWSDASTTTTWYRLERSDAGGAWHVVDDRIPNHQRYWYDDDLTPSSAYCWRLVGYNIVGSATSNTICGSTLAQYLPPPTDVTTTSTDTTLTMSWTDNATTEDRYLVGISTTPYTLTGVTWVTLPAGSGTMSYTFTGLTPNTKYYVQPFALLPGHWADVTGVAYPARTSGPPAIGSFSGSATAIQACAPQAVTLTWQTTGTTHVVVKAGSTVLADRTQTDPDPWSDSVAAPATDGNVVYTLTAYSPDGRSVSKTFTVSRGSAYPLIHNLMFSNTGWDTLNIVDVDINGNVIKTWGSITPGQYKQITLPNCTVHIVRLIDASTGRIAWDSNAILLGYDQGASYSYGVG